MCIKGLIRLPFIGSSYLRNSSRSVYYTSRQSTLHTSDCETLLTVIVAAERDEIGIYLYLVYKVILQLLSLLVLILFQRRYNNLALI